MRRGRAWETALLAGLILVTANRASAAPGVTELAAAAERPGGPELDGDLAQRVIHAWLGAAAVPLGIPDDPCEQCVTVLHELGKANGPVELKDLVAAVLEAAGGPVPDHADLADRRPAHRQAAGGRRAARLA